MGRNSGRGRGQSGRGRGKSSKKKSDKKPSSMTTKRKGLSDYTYYVGSAKQASDYVTVTNFLINYVRRTYTKGEDIANALEKLEEVDFTTLEPVMKQSSSSDAAVKERENKQFEKQYEIKYTEYERRVNQYQENRVQAEAMLWNQCTNTMKSKIQSRKDYYAEIKGNPVKLLQAIKEHALSYESTQYRMKTLCDALKSFINLKQKEDESAIDYLKRFKAARDVFYSHAGKGFCFPVLLTGDAEGDALAAIMRDPHKTDEEREAARDKMSVLSKKHMDMFHAYVYLENADRARYGSIVSGLESQFNLNNNQYPTTLIDAQNVVENHPYDAEYKRRKKQ